MVDKQKRSMFRLSQINFKKFLDDTVLSEKNPTQLIFSISYFYSPVLSQIYI